jgi:murein DD-endopeptidase MepM/ murein hydrolase activator NlpD
MKMVAKRKLSGKGLAVADKEHIYVVKRGDTLWGISRKLDVSIDQLALINDLGGRKRHMLQIGQRLELPGGGASSVDTELELRILDLAFRPIKRPRLKLDFDGATKEMVGDDHGHVGPVKVDDHAKGLSVWFRHLDGRELLIARHETLPMGRKRLTLTSRQMLVNGKYWFKKGTPVETSADVKREVRRARPEPHLPSPNAAAGSASKAPPTAKSAPAPVLRQTRVEGGNPQHAVGAVFTEENLLLSPPNEKYRRLLIDIAKRHKLTPQALAALINAEASKLKSGEWNANAKAESSSAAGLTQFLNRTWLEVATDRRSAVNQTLKARFGFEQVNGEWTGSDKNKKYSIHGKTGTKKTPIAANSILPWRFQPAYSIDAAAVYGLINLDYLSKAGLRVDSLAPEDLAKLMYLAHHEGGSGAATILKGELTEERAMELLPVQVGAEAAAGLAARHGGKYVRAYPAWLYAYTDSKINVTAYMVKPGGAAPRTMAQIAAALSGAPAPARPAPKAKAPAKTPPSAPLDAPAGAAIGFSNPLARCVVRTAGLASAKSATFGPVRNGGKRNHQGVDFEANPGTAVLAVAHGQVVAVSRQFAATKGFGASVLLSVDVHDLPDKQRRHYQSLFPGNDQVYFFYAHLSRIDVTLNKHGECFVKAGQPLGATGDSGNAQGMDTIARGAHLHFEVRHRTENIGLGLSGRLDPLPFIQSFVMPTA